MLLQFLRDLHAMYWLPKLILSLVVLKTIAVMIREAQLF